MNKKQYKQCKTILLYFVFFFADSSSVSGFGLVEFDSESSNEGKYKHYPYTKTKEIPRISSITHSAITPPIIIFPAKVFCLIRIK